MAEHKKKVTAFIKSDLWIVLLDILAVNGAYLALLCVCVMFIISASFTPFIYFNF